MIKLSIVVLSPKSKGYIFTSEDLVHIKNFLYSLKHEDMKATEKSVNKSLREMQVLPNKERFSIRTRQVSVDPANYTITSAKKPLDAKQLSYLNHVVQCAINYPATVIVCPDYITISSPKPRRKTKPKAE